MQIVNAVGISPAFLSDHSAITLQLAENQSERGPGFWKLNTSLLQDQIHRNKIEKIIDEEKAKEYLDPVIRWEMLKVNMRGETIPFSTRKKKSQTNLLQVLEKKLLDIESSLSH